MFVPASLTREEFRQVTTAEPSRILEEHISASDALVRELLSYAQALRHEGSDAQIHALSLYASTIELFSGCIVLAKSGEPTAIPVLLRPMYEALVDLDNLLQDASYVEYMEAANLKQVLKLLSAAEDNNPLLQGLTEGRPELSRTFAERFAELKAAGKRPLSIEARCRRAGRQNEYDSLYALFCLDSHNNSAALADRHMTDQANGVPLISFFQEPDPCVVARRLEMGMGILAQAALMLHCAFRIDSAQLEALVKSYETAREKRRGLIAN
jgi:Family of unknown function (DUF5677)